MTRRQPDEPRRDEPGAADPRAQARERAKRMAQRTTRLVAAKAAENLAERLSRPERGGERGAARAHLTRDRVLAEALTLADTEGIDHLSMRKLGAALGVEAMSLYVHVPNKAAILLGISDALYAEVRPPAPMPAPRWADELAAWVRALRDVFARHPGAVLAVALTAGSPPGPARTSYVESLAAVLTRTGRTAAAARALAAAIDACVIGQALARGAHDADPPADPLLAVILAGLRSPEV